MADHLRDLENEHEAFDLLIKFRRFAKPFVARNSPELQFIVNW